MSHANTHPRQATNGATLGSMSEPPLSEAIQDYLKGIYKLQAAGGRATVTALARDQGVSAAPASAMLKKLAVLDLLEHEPYRGARLTGREEGRAPGDPAIIACFEALPSASVPLGLHVDDVHDEADRLEHVISEELESRIDQALGYPTFIDPHGDPIPDANSRMACSLRLIYQTGRRMGAGSPTGCKGPSPSSSRPTAQESTAMKASAADDVLGDILREAAEGLSLLVMLPTGGQSRSVAGGPSIRVRDRVAGIVGGVPERLVNPCLEHVISEELEARIDQALRHHPRSPRRPRSPDELLSRPAAD